MPLPAVRAGPPSTVAPYPYFAPAGPPDRDRRQRSGGDEGRAHARRRRLVRQRAADRRYRARDPQHAAAHRPRHRRRPGGTGRRAGGKHVRRPAATPDQATAIGKAERARVRARDGAAQQRHQAAPSSARSSAAAQVRQPVAFSGLDLLTVLSDRPRSRPLQRRPRRRDRRRAGRLRLRGQPLRREPALDPGPRHARARSRRRCGPRSTASTRPRRGETTYRSTGQVPGFVLNQYALSEHKGDLRVASTEEPLWMNGAQQRDSESAVTVLRERDGRLEQVGSVGGLGKGERIYAVRFIGDVGYLVTFRQVDPLYTIDLSEPGRAEGRRRAEDHRLLGLPAPDRRGPAARRRPGGDRAGPARWARRSRVFDVSDPASPKRLHQRPLGGAGSSTQAEFDPHAFLWWGPSAHAVLPLQEYADGKPFSGAVGLRVRKARGHRGDRAHHARPDAGYPADDPPLARRRRRVLTRSPTAAWRPREARARSRRSASSRSPPPAERTPAAKGWRRRLRSERPRGAAR